MRKLFYPVLLLLLLQAQYIYGQFGTIPTQWPTPVGGLNYQDSGSAKVYGFCTANGNAYTPEFNGQSWQLIDMNGDKKPDLVVLAYVDSANQKTITQFNATNNPYWKVYLNNGTSFSTTAIQWATPQGGYGSIINHDTVMQGFFGTASDNSTGINGSQNWVLKDMDGDGKPDLVITGVIEAATGTKPVQFGATTNSPYWNVYLNNGNGFAASPTQWPTPVGGDIGEYHGVANNNGYWYYTSPPAESSYGGQYYDLQDVDGDGKPDLVVSAVLDSANGYVYQEFEATTNSPYWNVYLNNGAGFSNTITHWPTPTGGANFESQGVEVIGGFNAPAGGEGGSAWGSLNWEFVDINGDGKPDLVVTAVVDSINHGFAAQLTNGNTQYWNVYLNTGSGFSTTGINWMTPQAQGFKYVLLDSTYTFGLVTTAYDYAYNNPGEQTWKLMDMNNDGKPDLVFFGTVDSAGHLAQSGANQHPYWWVYYNNGNSFATTATPYYTPVGGLNFDTGGVTNNYGFNSNIGGVATGKYYGAQTWDVVDIDGDGKPDLVLTAVLDSAAHNYATEFDAATNPYWIVYINGQTDTVPTDTATGILPVAIANAGCVIYPNPNNGSFVLQFTTTDQRTVTVYDITGRMVCTPVTMQNQQQFNLGNISQGIYFLRITQNGNTSTLKFAIER